MKKLFSIAVGLFIGLAAFAQSAEEILARMEKVMEPSSQSEAIVMTMEMKIPILGTMGTRVYTFGDKSKMVIEAAGKEGVTWMDHKSRTSWTYLKEKNTVTIENMKPDEKSDSDDAEMFKGVAEGYDVSIRKETSDRWYIACKKSKTNKTKDDPKNMEIVVAKGTYMPISLSAKASGVTMTMKDIDFNVTEADVTFNPADFPGVTIEDKR